MFKILAVTSLVIALCVSILCFANAVDQATNVSGEMYLDYKYDISGIENGNETTHPNEFSISRVYVNVKSEFF